MEYAEPRHRKITKRAVMMLFCCAEGEEVAALEQGEALQPTSRVLWTSLGAAQDRCSGSLLVVDLALLPEAPQGQGAESVHVSHIPADAVRNHSPYLPPSPVSAAGGYVVRRGTSGEPEVLLIFRRGVWDLPKGKQDLGESIETCALREVEEEIGARQLSLVDRLGTTVHGYPEEGRYCIKTTHWFLMQTPERRFTPQEEEEIQAVAWVSWSEAVQRIGYFTLQQHMREVQEEVFRRFA